MRLLTSFALAYVLMQIAFAKVVDDSLYILPASDVMSYYINEVAKTTWKAGDSKFKGWSMESIRNLMGVPEDVVKGEREVIKLPLKLHDTKDKDIPTEFDSRKQWPNCPTIQEIRDQGNCGSCWAISAVETMSDRVCVASQNNKNAHLSTEDLLTCCKFCGFGCNGGYPAMAWKYFQRDGICTGGNYGTKEGCRPYTIEPCEHHTNGTRIPCQGESKTPKCVSTCQDGYNVPYKQDKNFGNSVYSVKKDVEQIQTEIMTNGPVQTAFTVYADFLNYKTGVYQYVKGESLGGHAVKIIGWGVDETTSTPYWLIANSWNDDWGEQGFFRIKRGSNECEIESNIVAGAPKV